MALAPIRLAPAGSGLAAVSLSGWHFWGIEGYSGPVMQSPSMWSSWIWRVLSD
jgi:hypothetical protein